MYWKKIQGSGPDSGWMGSGSDIFGYLFYFRVFLGMSGIFGFTHIYLGYFLTFNEG